MFRRINLIRFIFGPKLGLFDPFSVFWVIFGEIEQFKPNRWNWGKTESVFHFSAIFKKWVTRFLENRVDQKNSWTHELGKNSDSVFGKTESTLDESFYIMDSQMMTHFFKFWKILPCKTFKQQILYENSLFSTKNQKI